MKSRAFRRMGCRGFLTISNRPREKNIQYFKPPSSAGGTVFGCRRHETYSERDMKNAVPLHVFKEKEILLSLEEAREIDYLALVNQAMKPKFSQIENAFQLIVR